MEEFTIRTASADDCEALARHRCEMFKDMGILNVDAYQELHRLSVQYFSDAIPAGKYKAWLAVASYEVVGGVGLHLMDLAPRPGKGDAVLPAGRTGRILNVFVEKEWRGRGVARALVAEIIQFARDSGLSTLSLEASEAGKPMYEKLGFDPMSEMRMFL